MDIILRPGFAPHEEYNIKITLVASAESLLGSDGGQFNVISSRAVLASSPSVPPTHTWDFGPVSTVPENVALDKL